MNKGEFPMEQKVRSANTVWHRSLINREHRQVLNRHKSAAFWFTGLSGAGKSTLAHAVEQALHQYGVRTYVLDGDNIRQGLNGDLSFSDNDRYENVRRIGEVAKLFVDAGTVILAAFISPFQFDREMARAIISDDDFIEVYCRCPLEICEQRDRKGLYKKARQGELADFTGISSSYEPPKAPALVVDTHVEPLPACVGRVIKLAYERKVLTEKNCNSVLEFGQGFGVE